MIGKIIYWIVLHIYATLFWLVVDMLICFIFGSDFGLINSLKNSPIGGIGIYLVSIIGYMEAQGFYAIIKHELNEVIDFIVTGVQIFFLRRKLRIKSPT